VAAPITAQALDGLPEVAAGDDLGALIAAALPDGAPASDQVVVVAHKIVSKAEGRTRSLASVTPGERATRLARELGGRGRGSGPSPAPPANKDPRHVQVVLHESAEIRRSAHGVVISVTTHGFVCANAGVDASNSPDDDTLILLPADPDRSARQLRARLRELTGIAPAVLITDSFGRAWRHGQCDVAIGCAGLAPLEDWRGRADSRGRELKSTWIAVADQVAAAADLARAKDARQPVVLIGGARRWVTPDDGPGAQALLRGSETDLFR